MITPEFCGHCGAGIGIFRREGEGTCFECDKQGVLNHVKERCKYELDELSKIAERLARSMGHAHDCPKVQIGRCPCDCGCGKEQASALDEYQRWKANHN